MLKRLPSGAHLVTLPDIKLPSGWSVQEATILFVAPPGYPGSAPDCFWVEPRGIRLHGGSTPNGTNDSNPIPEEGPRGTWFSWHVQKWSPNSDSLTTYLNVIMRRFEERK
jgi:Prokaryotic E2 family E